MQTKGLKRLLAGIMTATGVMSWAAVPAYAGTAGDVAVFGHIYTSNTAMPDAEAAVVKDGKYIYVGDADGAAQYIDSKTNKIMLDDGMMLSGFTDGNSHYAYKQYCDDSVIVLKGIDKKAGILDAVRKYIFDNPANSCYVASGCDKKAVGDAGISLAELDKLSASKPIIIVDASGSEAWVNSATLKLALIDRYSKAPEGSTIVWDAEGRPNGCLKGEIIQGVMGKMPDPSLQAVVNSVKRADLRALSYGYTAIVDAEVNSITPETFYRAYKALDDMGELKAHTYGCYEIDNNMFLDVELNKAIAFNKSYSGKKFRADRVAMILDGEVKDYAANLLEPYSTPKPGKGITNGALRFSPTVIGRAVTEANEAGMTVQFRALGDGAVNKALLAFEEANKITGQKPRNSVALLELVGQKDYNLMAFVNATAVTAPLWAAKEEDFYTQSVPCLGEARAEKKFPVQSFCTAGVNVSFCSDYPFENAYGNPAAVNCIQSMVTRSMPGKPETVLNEAECTTLDQALMVATMGGARQVGRENEYGSIEVGKNADFVILDKDLTKLDPQEIYTAKVLKTFVDGELVYENGVTQIDAIPQIIVNDTAPQGHKTHEAEWFRMVAPPNSSHR